MQKTLTDLAELENLWWLNTIERDSPGSWPALDALRDAFDLPKWKRGYPRTGPERDFRYRDPYRPLGRPRKGWPI
jgi:hypothetical protein